MYQIQRFAILPAADAAIHSAALGSTFLRGFDRQLSLSQKSGYCAMAEIQLGWNGLATIGFGTRKIILSSGVTSYRLDKYFANPIAT